MLSLLTDGDYYEKICYDLFLKDRFPSYESFWNSFIVPLTNRPIDVHTKTDIELRRQFPQEDLKRIHERIIILQLHYSVFRMLHKAFGCIGKSDKEINEVENFFSSVYSALDISAELFGRYEKVQGGIVIDRDCFDPSSLEKDSRDIRKKWQKNHSYPQTIGDIRKYRNLMHHGQMFGSIVTPAAGFIALPRPSEIEKYLDWRSVGVSYHSSNIHDFLYSKDIVKLSFDEVIIYLEAEWKNNLL